MIYKIAVTTFTSEPKGYQHGLEFIHNCIIPIWDQAKKIEINVDGLPDNPQQFIKGAFVGLSNMYGYKKCQEKIVIVTEKTELKKDAVRYLKTFAEKSFHPYRWYDQ